jgi:hypothetical protein
LSTPIVTIGTPEIAFADGLTTVSADISLTGTDRLNIWYSLPLDRVSPEQASDAFFVIGHRLAMVHEASLVMNTPVSNQLIHGSRSLEDIFGLWFPDHEFVVDTQVKPRRDEPDLPDNRGLATCFTGGIDSMYSLLNPPRNLSHAVFVHGFDISLGRTTYHAKISKRLNKLTEALGVPLLQVTSNVRDLASERLTWGYHLHGPAIASVGILLAEVADELLLPSSETSRHIGTNNGSHQITDRLTSTEYLHITHHGTKVSRINKTALIAQNKTALKTVRPCYRSYVAYNCGECPKCIRTSLEMEIIGCRKAVKANFKVWHTRAELLAGIKVTTPTAYRSARGAIAYIEEHGGNQAFLEALQAAAADFELRQAKASLITTLSHLSSERTDQDALSALREGFDGVRARWRRRQIRQGASRAKARIRALDPRRSEER